MAPDYEPEGALTGGLKVYHEPAPPSWGFVEYNGYRADSPSKRKVDALLGKSGWKATRIPYRANRVAIFQSDLFHNTDGVPFASEGHESHRINLTYLFGERAGL